MNDQVEDARMWLDSDRQACPLSKGRAAIAKNFSSWPFIQECLVRKWGEMAMLVLVDRS